MSNKKILQLRKLINISMKKEKSEISDVILWLKKRQKMDRTITKLVPLNDLSDWSIKKNGKIKHKSSQFFTIEGIKIFNAYNREVKKWDQPILKQKHGGFLAILFKIEGGIVKFLLLARREPGDRKMKLCPSFSATQSNLNKAHGGKMTDLHQIVFDKKKIFCKTYHDEEGARFYKKTNCNLLIKINKKDEKKIKDKNFIWLTYSQIKNLNFKRGILNPFVKTILFMI